MKKNACVLHGELTPENAYVCKEKTAKDGIRLRCKICCHERRVLSYYDRRDENIRKSIEWKKENREYVRENAKENYWKDIEGKRKKERTRKKNLNLAEYEQMVKEQDNKCAICGKEESRKRRFSEEVCPLCIDHCHTTGKIRGLLCHDCNTGIGKLKDNIVLLESAIRYLRKDE